MVDIAVLKQLRAQTHAPLKDCKEALEEAGGDLVKAETIMREKGALKAESKSDRVTNEGIVWIKQNGDKISGVKLACETDFVAKNDTFRSLADQIADRMLTMDNVANIDELDQSIRDEFDAMLKDNFVTIGENMQLHDVFVSGGNCFVYRHPGDKVASVIFYEGEADRAKEVALQVAAMNPEYLSIDDVPAEKVEELKALYRKELEESGKPADIIEKILIGKINKARSEIVLLEQDSIIDDSKKVKDLLGDTVVSRYIRFAI